jgi:hypothetical protein
MKKSYESVHNGGVDRRRFLTTALGACAISPPLAFLSGLASSAVRELSN